MDFESLFATTDNSTPPQRNGDRPVRDETVFGLRIRRPEASVTLVEVSGPLDLGVVERFDTELRGLVTDGSSRLVVDLSGVTFLCAGGIATLLDVDQRTREKGFGLVLVTDAHPVDRPLQALGLMRRFTFGDPPLPGGEAEEPVGDDGPPLEVTAATGEAELQFA